MPVYVLMQQAQQQQQAKQVSTKILVVLLAFYSLWLLLTLVLPAHFADLPLAQWVQQYRHPVLRWLALAIGIKGKPEFVLLKVLLPALLLIFYGYRREAIFLLATLLADTGNLVLKELIARPRPAGVWLQVLDDARNPGFPSGHTVNFIVYFGFWLLLLPVLLPNRPGLRKALFVVYLLLMLLAPWSRIYTGMHWPSDVIGGGFFGVLVLWMLSWAYLTGPSGPKPLL